MRDQPASLVDRLLIPLAALLVIALAAAAVLLVCGAAGSVLFEMTHH